MSITISDTSLMFQYFAHAMVGDIKAESFLQSTNLKLLLQYLHKLDVANKSLIGAQCTTNLRQ